MVKELHIENTSLCNAGCAMCARNVRGEGVANTFTPSNMSFDTFQAQVTVNMTHLEKVMFCGNLGDPCADNGLLQKIKWLKSIRPNCVVGINTNGSIQNPQWWTQLAQLLTGVYDYVVFSIDGLEDTNHIYRTGVRWDKIMANASAYINAGGSAHWDMLVFAHNHHQVEQCKQTAYDMGFTWFRSKETDRWDQFTFDHLKPVNEYKKIDYNSVDSVDCERNRDCSKFIDHTGQQWPCCHMAEMYYSVNNIQQHSDILAHTPNELTIEYQRRLDADNPFYVCKRSCSRSVNKRSQWKTEYQLR
jgi:MoaA/NifB/PqqE/SkfB family radical SAM enzyme